MTFFGKRSDVCIHHLERDLLNCFFSTLQTKQENTLEFLCLPGNLEKPYFGLCGNLGLLSTDKEGKINSKI